ncbi:MAG TPA: isochorismatase family protein [Cytophagaceae bacterium]|jgi:nicotinamidase-related amidase|nr:isochorismatase family protein [Cytophagaceae bacterium]
MITAIDKNTALVLIDLQKGVLKLATALPIMDVLEKAAELVTAFRKENLPIVVVKVIPPNSGWINTRKDNNAMRTASALATTAPDFADIVDNIKTLPSDIFITKHTWNAFYNTSLHNELQKRNITGIVLAGVSTSAGVEGTARAAAEAGYNISFATDAMTDMNLEAHQNSIKNIFPRLGEQGTSYDIIEKLPHRNK